MGAVQTQSLFLQKAALMKEWGNFKTQICDYTRKSKGILKLYRVVILEQKQ